MLVASSLRRREMALATLWLYVRIQFFVFVCGIVGPIFLVIFFTSRPQPELRWMYWAGLLITTADVLIALLITSGIEAADNKPQKASG
jgi:hypothetical protein